MKYRKKPVVIEAIQFNGENAKEIIAFCETLEQLNAQREGENIAIKTLEGTMIANIDDYIIKGVKGEFYPCKPDIFEQTYEVVE